MAHRDGPAAAAPPAERVPPAAGRVAIGVVFFAHRRQKSFTNGVDGTAAFIDEAGVPAAQLSARFATMVELIGGATLVPAVAVPVAGILGARNGSARSPTPCENAATGVVRTTADRRSAGTGLARPKTRPLVHIPRANSVHLLNPWPSSSRPQPGTERADQDSVP